LKQNSSTESGIAANFLRNNSISHYSLVIATPVSIFKW